MAYLITFYITNHHPLHLQVMHLAQMAPAGCHGFCSPLFSGKLFNFPLLNDVGYILVVYMDDIVTTGDDFEVITRLKQFLQQTFLQ